MQKSFSSSKSTSKNSSISSRRERRRSSKPPVLKVHACDNTTYGTDEVVNVKVKVKVKIDYYEINLFIRCEKEMIDC